MAEQKQFKGIAKDFINNMRLHFIGKGADPNDIFVQDLFSYEPPTNKVATGLLSRQRKNFVNQLTTEDRKILETILQVYNEHVTTKREVLTQSRKLFDTDIVQTVIDVMIDDGFNSFNNEDEEFRIEYDLSEDDRDAVGQSFQEQVQNEIDSFVEKFAIKSKVAELVPELLRDGEYALGILFDDEGKKGITEIVDELDVINLIPFYNNDKLAFVINQNEFDNTKKNRFNFANNTINLPSVYKPDNVVFFRLKGATKKRINMSTFYDAEFRNLFFERTNIKLPKYVRISLPIYASAMKNLNRLQLMENISTVLDLGDVLKPEIVTVTVPSNTNATEAQQIIRDYERQLNDASGFGDTDALDISTLATQANRRKVLPQWMDSKGTLTTAGINQQSKSEGTWNSIAHLRNLIALSIGIPPFYINLTEGAQDKAQIIKLYSRYTRKLTSLQKSLADGIKDLIMIHLEKRGLNISRANLSVKFKAITSGDSLDDTDMMVATVTGINDLYKGIEEITSSSNNNLVIDDQQFKELFDNLTSRYLNISDLIKIDDNKFNEDEFGGDDEDGGFEPLGSPRPRTKPSKDSDFEPTSSPSEMDAIDRANDAAYNDFATATDNIELEEPQIITTEG